ncbi:glycosyltransferase family 4 protein [Echinicola marina]|uniref:glycosyltransferase family 4 protein n=1 Tax=Echinicola marina TaxID=2859768 RepID=UPI001CF65FD4|nr:glycosyltransferase family 4 protein [Echinicola marina]UCS93237.1 glycosyltransferase family 4 protein [Echinicola marina]
MKILFFYQYFGTPKGSWSTRIYELTKRWVKEGHEVTVVTAPYDKSDIKASSFISHQKIEGINLIVIDLGDSNRFNYVTRAFRAILFSIISIWYSIFRTYDVCISSSGPITIGFPLIVSKWLRRKKTVFEVRDLWPAGGIELGLIKGEIQKKISIIIEKLCYYSSNLIITASVGQKDHIQKRFEKLTIEVIPNASDIEVFNVEGNEPLPEWTTGKVIFTHIGSLGLIHNISFWLDVARNLKELDENNTVSLVFIGDGKDRLPLLEQKERYKLDNIFFLGLMPKSQLPKWVNNSRATLFATLDNPVQSTCSPNKIFDSFAAGVPIVQTTTGWIRDLVDKEKCGINVSLSSPRDAAKKILWLANNSDEASIMGKNAFSLAMSDFNRDILSKKYLDLLSQI